MLKSTTVKMVHSTFDEDKTEKKIFITTMNNLARNSINKSLTLKFIRDNNLAYILVDISKTEWSLDLAYATKRVVWWKDGSKVRVKS